MMPATVQASFTRWEIASPRPGSGQAVASLLGHDEFAAALQRLVRALDNFDQALYNLT